MTHDLRRTLGPATVVLPVILAALAMSPACSLATLFTYDITFPGLPGASEVIVLARYVAGRPVVLPDSLTPTNSHWALFDRTYRIDDAWKGNSRAGDTIVVRVQSWPHGSTFDREHPVVLFLERWDMAVGQGHWGFVFPDAAWPVVHGRVLGRIGYGLPLDVFKRVTMDAIATSPSRLARDSVPIGRGRVRGTLQPETTPMSQSEVPPSIIWLPQAHVVATTRARDGYFELPPLAAGNHRAVFLLAPYDLPRKHQPWRRRVATSIRVRAGASDSLAYRIGRARVAVQSFALQRAP